jgi:hypothetical protein
MQASVKQFDTQYLKWCGGGGGGAPTHKERGGLGIYFIFFF